MKLQLFQSKEQTEDRIDIYYTKMNPVIRKVIDVVHTNYPVLKSKEEDEIRYVNIDHILYLDCVDKKVFAYTRERVYPLEETLSYYETLLSNYGYTRISKSNIVNVYRIKAMRPEINMRICAIFENEEKLYVNRSYKKSFMDYLVNRRGCINEK